MDKTLKWIQGIASILTVILLLALFTVMKPNALGSSWIHSAQEVFHDGIRVGNPDAVFVDKDRVVTATDVNISDDLTVTDGISAADLTATDDLTVGDDSTFTDDVAITGNLTATNTRISYNFEVEGTASLYNATVFGTLGVTGALTGSTGALSSTLDVDGAQTNSSTIIATGAITSRAAVTAGTNLTTVAGGDLSLGGSTYGTASSILTGFSCQNWQSTTSADVYACSISNGAVVCALGTCSN